MKILLTGAAGFIGSAVCRRLAANPALHVTNVDKLTYAGNLASLRQIENAHNYLFVRADINEEARILDLLRRREIDVIMGTIQPATVRGDELRLRELILNLVDNAVKYSHPCGKVEIDLRVEGATARLAVRDYGIGIPQDAHKQIFDRFFRTDDARAHTKKGTGLGLAICAWIADAHHGHIDVQSEVGKGSTFTLVLPLAPAAA